MFGVSPLGKACYSLTDTRLGQGVEVESGKQRLSFGDQSVEVSSLAAEHVGQHLDRSMVRAVVAGSAERHHRQSNGQVGFELKGFRFHRLQVHLFPWGQFLGRDVGKELFDLSQCLLRFDVADDDHNGVVGRVPGVVEFLEHGAGGLVEGGLCPQSVMGVDRSPEHPCQKFGVEDIFRAGEVLGHFLLDSSPFFLP